MPKKLYRVEIEAVYYAVAENAIEAESYATDYLRDSYDLVTGVREVTPTTHKYLLDADGWTDDSLVYFDGGDLEFGEAKRRVMAGEPIDAESDTEG